MADFLFHMVSEREKKEIKKQSKIRMNNFSKKLSFVGKIIEPKIERPESERKEGEDCQYISREIMFDNALKKNKNFIIADKKKW